jgi:uncharacterized membrane protein
VSGPAARASGSGAGGGRGAGGRGAGVGAASAATPSRMAVVIFACVAVLALVGLADSVYLTVEHLKGNTLRCTITSGCSEVLGSRYAVIAGVPLAAFGAAGYFAAFSLATLAAFGNARAPVLLLLLVAVMFTTTLWLLYLQAFVLQAFCQYCLLSAAVTTLNAGLLVLWRVTRRRAAA